MGDKEHLARKIKYESYSYSKNLGRYMWERDFTDLDQALDHKRKCGCCSIIVQVVETREEI